MDNVTYILHHDLDFEKISKAKVSEFEKTRAEMLLSITSIKNKIEVLHQLGINKKEYKDKIKELSKLFKNCNKKLTDNYWSDEFSITDLKQLRLEIISKIEFIPIYLYK